MSGQQGLPDKEDSANLPFHNKLRKIFILWGTVSLLICSPWMRRLKKIADLCVLLPNKTHQEL